jgi:hypothetical protein
MTQNSIVNPRISAKIIAHSKSSETGKEIVTFELEYWRAIHAELNR